MSSLRSDHKQTIVVRMQKDSDRNHKHSLYAATRINSPKRVHARSSLEANSRKELTLGDLGVIYRRRRQIVYWTICTILLLAALYSIFSTRRYQAKGTIQVQKESVDAMGLESMMSGATDGASDALQANIVIATQAAILQSDTLAIKTIKDLHMEQTADFKPRWNPVGWALGLIQPRGVADPVGASLEDSPARRRHALMTFHKNLTVKPVSGTKLIEISYMNPDPKLASAVVNYLVQALVDYTFQTRFNATNQASVWLRGQLGDLREQSEELQKKVVALQRESGVYALGNVDATGKEIAYSYVLDDLQQKSQALNQAEQARIVREAIARAAQTNNAELLSGLAGNTPMGTSMNSSLQLLQNLRQQQATEAAALKEAEAKYGSAYPKLAEMRNNLASIDAAIRDEIKRIQSRAKSDYQVSQQTEASSRANLDKAREEANKLNDKAIEYAIVRQEAEGSRKLYEGLVAKLREAGVLEGIKSSNITVVDAATPPAKPTKPNIPMNMAAALVGGAFMGIFLALLVDIFDNKLISISDTEDVIGRKLLGVTPSMGKQQEFIGNNLRYRIPGIDEPRSNYTEAMRAIRTALLLTSGSEHARVLMITSSIPSEGKTNTALNLAVLLGQTGKKVLLVDSDMRRGTLRSRLNLARGNGLSNLLAGNTKDPNIVPIEGAENIWVITAGDTPPNPAELLGTEGFKNWLKHWRSEYDYILLDAPPLLPVADAHVLKSLADISLLVARMHLTERRQLRRSLEILEDNGSSFIGVILNGLSESDDSYYGYYGYRKYNYKYAESEEENDHA